MTVYVTSTQLKATLNITDTAMDADVTIACAAASEVIEGYKDTRFYPTSETRVYSPPSSFVSVYNPDYTYLPIDDLNSLTALKVDIDGDGVYETTWTRDTEFYLAPLNADKDGRPWNRVVLRPQAGQVFPRWPSSVQIQGSFGWATTPNRVTQAATIIAGRFVKRARETPYGILTIVGDGVAAARLGKIDPDVALLLDSEYAELPVLFL